MSSNPWIEIGVIGRAHGVRGWVRVHLTDPASDTLDHLEDVSFTAPSGRRVAILEAEPDAQGWRVHFEGINDRNAAETLSGTHLFVERDRLPVLADDQVYVTDLVGCAVVDVAGATLGTVRDVIHTGAHETLVLDLVGGGEAMIPLVDGIVTSVDVEARRVVCDPPEGLLEINR